MSRNDIGLNGTHQSGMLIPRPLSHFFPSLNDNDKNPRIKIFFSDKKNQKSWSFNFIHYNNKLFGGTRFEYRLTKMTNFLRASGAKEKDIIQFSYDSVNNLYFIDLIKEENLSNEGDIIEKGNRVFQVSNWEVVS